MARIDMPIASDVAFIVLVLFLGALSRRGYLKDFAEFRSKRFIIGLWIERALLVGSLPAWFVDPIFALGLTVPSIATLTFRMVFSEHTNG